MHVKVGNIETSVGNQHALTPVFQCVDAQDVIDTFEGVVPTIPLSRAGTSCHTLISQLEDHNNHSPAFTDLDSLDDYMKRTFKLLSKALGSHCVSSDIIQYELPNIKLDKQENA